MIQSPRDSLEVRREEARAALEGEEWREKRKEKEEARFKRRREAMLAMEGETHRKRREKEERESHEQTRKTLARKEATGRELQDRRRREAEVEAEQTRELKKADAEKTERLERISWAERTIEDIKKAGLVLSPIRTLKTDMAQAVREGSVSVAKIALAEQASRRKKGGEGEGHEGRHGSKIAFGAVLTVLIIGSGASFVFFSYYWPVGPTPPAPGETVSRPTIAPLIFADSFVEVGLTSTTTPAQAAAKLRAAAAESDDRTIKYVYLTDGGRASYLKDFIRLLDLRFPEGLTRYLDDDFMFGVYRRSRFLVLKTAFFERVFAGMLDWETSLIADLQPFLTDPDPTEPETRPRFADYLIRNKDARVARDADGKIVFFYAFLDNAHLVITTETETFLEILNRFIANP